MSHLKRLIFDFMIDMMIDSDDKNDDTVYEAYM